MQFAWFFVQQVRFLVQPLTAFYSYFSFLKLGFTPCKAEESLRDTELQEKKHKNVKAYRKTD